MLGAGGAAARRVVPLVLMATLAVAGQGCQTRTTQTGTPAGTGHGAEGSGGGGLHGPGSDVPARDSFRGSIRSARGSLSGSTGRAQLYLRPAGNGPRRSVKITIVALPCAGASHCLELSGTATGTLSATRSRLPDVGHAEMLTASGSIRPLGQATIQGEVRGTGFIQSGRETLILTVSSPSGAVTLEALSSPVKGFSSP